MKLHNQLNRTENLEQDQISFLGESDTRTLFDLIQKQIIETPDETAVISNQGDWSYKMLDKKSANIASLLHQHGAKQGEYVGLFVDPSPDLIFGVWGAIYAGCGYLPLSPEYPEKRISYMLKDSKARLVLTQAHLKEQITALVSSDITVISIDDVDDNTSYYAPLSQDSLAYMIYTSGSTGDPKGVIIEHSSIVNQLLWLKEEHSFSQSTRIVQKTPFSFDAAQWEILANAIGICVVTSEVGMYRDPLALIDLIIEKQVTVLQCVPTLLQALLDSPCIQLCNSLSHVFSGGETLTKQLALQFFETLPEKDLINLYGPTECTINSSSHKVTPHTLEQAFDAITIGKPVANTHYYILDEQLNLVDEGESGELYISGVQVARGYLNRNDTTLERFISNPHNSEPMHNTLYRSGDIVKRDKEGNTHFLGRADNQIKLRGYRVELDEIRLAIEKHDWIKNAAMVVKNDQRTGFQNLIACIELNHREAALMDQGKQSEHHQSKKSKLQVKAQLSNAGFRQPQALLNLPVFNLPNKNASKEQTETVFARKTYRYFDGGNVCEQEILNLLKKQKSEIPTRPVSALEYDEFGQIMRYFGQFKSKQRLLPKYGYASPGALYATQLFLEIHNLFNLKSGIYYYHPELHTLHLVRSLAPVSTVKLTCHFLGKQSAIEPVYQNNILEVLEMETGHMLGLFDHILPQFGLSIGAASFDNEYQDYLAVHEDDAYLGSFDISQHSETDSLSNVETLVQIQNVDGLNSGQYTVQDNQLTPLSDQLIEKKKVIAINQQVYDRASFGISLLNHSTTAWRHYIDLGRKLQQLQMNDLNIGLMSSGYSSKSGNNLPSANRIEEILSDANCTMKPFYFCIGGKITDEQKRSEGMKEDAIHMRGPLEILNHDLQNSLPSYMVPNKIITFAEFPQTANGKVDYLALKNSEKLNNIENKAAYIEPRNKLEEKIADIWLHVMKWDKVSVQDNFFESGGNSLTAVTFMNTLNKELSISIPMQAIFQAPTIEALALYIKQNDNSSHSRLINLNNSTQKSRIFCWPGLGGYPMSLKPLAEKVADEATFIAVQAHGLNSDEIPYDTIQEMAEADIKLIKNEQPTGPYTLWGYSFGARVAFEVAHQLEASGETVEALYLIAPGSPNLPQYSQKEQTPCFTSPAFVTILFSVFFQKIQGPVLEQCLSTVTNKQQFIDFVCMNHRTLNRDVVSKIIEVVMRTYEFKYTFTELLERQVKAPKVIFKAQGDDYSFIENIPEYNEKEAITQHLQADHYALLKHQGVDELFNSIVQSQGSYESYRSLLIA
ncbi:amino acid adenylation domain-containing protein [Pseudoalteromonas fuliginea]|uniref:Amino acid adenylation protein n=1 Tax=Pseudoalteromonas fuliginea TaxID=1872678 RepID=A0ABD3YAC0_9GAMM|nr:amino acid adenylation domain-containing protein [Pseudoalteromonas fuliginea]KDC51526.1 amino acid adenylation protein [Pseudoalteromonas fuliginea]KJZ29809.1 amino acid adenylation protein [Pseudoalteromonas fuliginea]